MCMCVCVGVGVCVCVCVRVCVPEVRMKLGEVRRGTKRAFSSEPQEHRRASASQEQKSYVARTHARTHARTRTHTHAYA